MEAKKPADIWLFSLTVVLLVIGLFMVFDASYARAGQGRFTGGDSLFFLKRQASFAVAGLIAMFLAMRVRYWKLRPWAAVFLMICIAGLGIVLLPGIGKESHGAVRWVEVGPITVQPSEFAKLGLILYLAAALSAKREEIRDWKLGLLPLAFPVGLVIFLVAIEDLGTAIVLTMTALFMLYMAGVRNRHFAVIAAACIALAVVAIMIEPFRLKRMASFMNPFKDYHGAGYQVCHSLIALGSGGLFGVGLCEGREKLFYLPAEHTDFIFAVLGEEAGLIGTAVLALLFLALAARGLKIASVTKEGFGKLLAAGLSLLVGGQALLNMLVVTSSVPATGVPLPFISYGGSSLALNLLGMGVLLGISQYPKRVESYEDENRVNRRRYRRSRVSRHKHR